MYMHLTEFTDNALRLLVYLGNHRERIATINEIAERYGISRHHLAKVSCVLSASGLIETSRGRLGGMRLAGAPRDIRLGEVVRCTERGLARGARSDPRSAQRSAQDGERPPCRQPDDRLQQSLAVATAAYLAELNRVTLADLIPGGGEAHGEMPGWLATNAWRWQHSTLEEGA
ncbi:MULTISPECIES: Rrf2 family transcriptional regulator [Massilia]|uniref:Rrf2 family transcriptional regulator n=1 Tax=Massilia TaxID=149698 RepID=UPI001E47EB22|nr:MULTISPECIES: Rrf2 family transcriptional regulator [Massilia]MDY0960717.1 Rrf2 family transcriptional regulator [Massilia sp. CFBP9026]